MSEGLRYFLATILVLICVGLFIFSYRLNHKTPKPDDDQNLKNECETCQMTSCSHQFKNKKKEG